MLLLNVRTRIYFQYPWIWITTQGSLITYYWGIRYSYSFGSLLTDFRRPGGSCGRALGEVGQPACFDPHLTHSSYIRSKWALYVVAIAWLGAIGGTLTLFAWDVPEYSEGMPSQILLRAF